MDPEVSAPIGWGGDDGVDRIANYDNDSFHLEKRVMKQTRHFNMFETILVDLMIGLTVGMAIPAAILVALTTPIETVVRGIQKHLTAFSFVFRDVSAVLLILFRE